MNGGYVALRRLGVSELGLAILLMREPACPPDVLAERLGFWFGLRLDAQDIAPCLERMTAKALLVALPEGGHALRSTGEDVASRALGGLVRIIDRDRGIWDAAVVLRLIELDIRRGVH